MTDTELDQLSEVLARSMCRRAGLNPDLPAMRRSPGSYMTNDPPPPAWMTYLSEAKATLIEAKEAGWRFLPPVDGR